MSDMTPDEWADLPEGDLRKMLSDAKAEAAKANERAEAAEKTAKQSSLTAAFAEAGIPADGVGALVRKTYEGEPDAEAIKVYAADYLPPQAAAEPTAEEQAAAAAAAAEASAAAGRANAAVTQGEPPPAPPSLDQGIAAAQSPEELTAFLTGAGVQVDAEMI